MPANPSFDDIATTTLQLYSGDLADNATRTIALLDRLRRKGKVKPADGGRTIVQELEVALNTNGGWFAGYDVLTTSAFEPFTAAEYAWKQAYMPCVWSGSERRMNNGRSQVIDLITSRIANTRKSLFDLVAQAAYSDGTGSGGKQMHGLQLLVVASPSSGTVGGIDRSTNTFWRNQTGTTTMSATIQNLAANNPSQFLHALNALAIACTRGTDRPDMYIADSVGYTHYLESLQPLQRITSTEMAGYGFTALKYYLGGDADFVLDNGYCPSKTVYALNTDYLYLRPHPDLNFAPLGGERQPFNQDAFIKFLGFQGNMCSSNLSLQGILSSSN